MNDLFDTYISFLISFTFGVIIINVLEAGLKVYYETAGKNEAVLFVKDLLKFDEARALELQQTYNLPNHSPICYEALQVLNIVNALRKSS